MDYFRNFAAKGNDMSVDNKFDHLKAYFKQLLPAMTPEAWKVTERILAIRHYSKGDFIVREGEVCDQVSFINYGLVRMYYLVDGKEKIVSFCNELNFISEYASFLTRKPAKSFVQALEDTEVICISYKDLQMLYEKVPEANLLGRMIAENLFLEMSEGSSDEMKHSLIGRYTSLIDKIPWLPQRVPQYMIASYLGITPEGLSRIKSRVAKQKRVKEGAY